LVGTDRIVRSLLAGFVMILLARLAAAQWGGAGQPLRWHVTLLGVWYSGATPYHLEGPISGDARFASAPGYGVRAGYDLWPWLGLEISWTRAVTQLELSGSPPATLGSRQLNTIEVGANFSWIRGPLRLFLSTGIGGAGTGSKGGINLTANAGIGVSVSLDRHLALRLDERWRATYGNLAPGDSFAFCDSSGCYAYRHPWYESSESSGGLTVSF
jgi:hypothetical protein